MPVIRPVSDLRNHFTAISQILHEEEEPVFFTKNGVGDMVLMSIEYYEQQLARLNLYEKLDQARAEIATGARGKNAKDVLTALMQ